MQSTASTNEIARLDAGRFHVELDRPRLMGVVNLTPDSFSDGGRFDEPAAAIAHANALIQAGADLIDLGAESSRPGAAPVSAEDQWRRLEPVLRSLAAGGVPVSIDTRDARVMRRAIAAGAAMINDIEAMGDADGLAAVADSDVAVCIMHMQGDPLTMQHAPVYRDVVSEVGAFLQSRVRRLQAAGVGRGRIVVDPGIGFGKRLEHNLALLRSCRVLEARCGAPVLIGASRKSMLGELTGRRVDERLAASVGAALAAVAHGARLLRVHDVAATRDALSVWQAVNESTGE